MDLWYAHQGTTVYMLTKLPEGETRKAGYEDSGWTTYERCSAEQIKKVYLYKANWKLVLDLGSDDEVKRNWPIGPDEFEELIAQKVFTNGSDMHAVMKLFRQMSQKQLGGIAALDFDGMRPPSTQEAKALGGCLSLCGSLKKLDLCRVGLTDESTAALFANLAMGALANLINLNLRWNEIGDEGIKAFSVSLATGALANLKSLDLAGNPASDEAQQRAQDALKQR